MIHQLFAGLFTEGTTDIRFLESIVKNTIEQVAFNCTGQFEIEVIPIKFDKSGSNFNSQILKASEQGNANYGISILCVQADADSFSLKSTYENKIKPVLSLIQEQSDEKYCKTIVAIVPIQETESWLLADKELLKRKIGTDLSDNELDINRPPESIARPKEVIENALRKVQQSKTKRQRRNQTIADLYLPVGQEIELGKLELLASYQDFKNNVINAFRKLNYLH